MSKTLLGTKGLLAILFVALLTGCGFYLKGNKPLPSELSEVHVDYLGGGYETIQPRLLESLRTQLVRRGARVVSSATAPGHLKLHRLREETRVLSVGPDGKGIEYEIETTVEFDFSVDGKLRVPRDTLVVLREYSFDETRVLAKEAERKQLQREMQEELAALILLRIDAVLRNPPPEPAPVAEPAG